MDSAAQARRMAQQLIHRDPALAAQLHKLAAARGITVEQWLAQALEHLHGEQVHDDAALVEADQAALAQVAMQLQALLAAGEKRDAQEEAPTGAHNGAEKTMEQELANIVHRLQSREEAIEGQLKRLAEHLQQLTGQLQNLQAPANDEGMARVEEALAQMVQHMERAEVRMAEAIGDLNERIDEVAERANEALKLSSEQEQLRPWLERLEVLEEKLKALQEASSPAAAADLPLQELVAGMEQVQRISEELPTRAEQAARAAAQRLLSDVEARLEVLSSGLEQVDRLGRELARLDEEIAAIGQQVADLRQASQAAAGVSAEDMQAVHEALQLIAGKLEEKADRSEVDALATRLEEFSAQLAQTPAAAGGDDGRLQELEQQVLKLKDLLKQAVEEPLAVATERLAVHEERFAALEAGLGRIDGIEQALAQLQQALREEQAASTTSAGEEIAALHKGLQEVRALAKRTQGESHAMLEEVQHTLQLIVERLGKLERQEGISTGDVQTSASSDPARSLLAEEAPAAHPAAAERLQPAPSSAENAEASLAIDPQEVAATIAALSGAEQRKEAAGKTGSTRRHDDAQDTSQETFSRQMDFIAAARRAALSANEDGQNGERQGRGLLARLKALARRRARGGHDQGQPLQDETDTVSQPRGETDTAVQRRGIAGRLAALRPFRRSGSETGIAAPAAVNATSDAASSGVAVKRRRLLLAGVVLLSAVALYLSQAGKSPSPAPGSQQAAAVNTPERAMPELPPSAGTPAAQDEAEERDDRDAGMAVPQEAATKPPTSQGKSSPQGENAAQNESRLALSPSGERASGGEESSSATNVRTTSQDVAAPALLPPSLGTPALRLAAVQGDARAQMLVALHYLRGDGVKRDVAAAARWMEKAAKKGLTVAQYRLGTMYEKGLGVVRDAARAAQWYERAALAGNVKAMHNLAVLHASGALGRKDFERAAHWFERAARHGVRDSQFNLAVLHHRGLGVRRDLARAWFWYELAARQGDEAARTQAAQLAEYLGKDRLAAMRRELESFKPAPVVRNANVVVIDRPEWRRNATAAIDTTASPVDDAGKPLSGRALVRRVQQLLSQLGYDVGPVDGVLGARTANAIRLFQLQRRLPVSGKPDARLLKELERAVQGQA